MKALILNFRSFEGKKETSKGKLFVTFDMYDVEKNMLFKVFQDAGTLLTPDGVIPNKDDVQKTFPRIANLETRLEQYPGPDGRPACKFYVDAIKDWKYVDLKKL